MAKLKKNGKTATVSTENQFTGSNRSPRGFYIKLDEKKKMKRFKIITIKMLGKYLAYRREKKNTNKMSKTNAPITKMLTVST